MPVYQEEKIEITPECAWTRAREGKGLRGMMPQQREKMSAHKRSTGSKQKAWCWTVRCLKCKRHCSRLEQQEEAEEPEARTDLTPPGHSQLSSAVWCWKESTSYPTGEKHVSKKTLQMPNMSSHLGNAHEHCNEIPPHTCHHGYNQK